MRVVAVGGREFVACLRLGGTGGVVVRNTSEALGVINNLLSSEGVGLILVSDEFGEEMRERLNEIRSRVVIPLIYEIPAPSSSAKPIDYRALLRNVLGV